MGNLLPKNSEVWISGVADGRFLYNAMNERIHPIGDYRKNIIFRDVYNYLNCLDTSPCKGWLNTDKDVRDRTSQRADELNQAAKAVVRDGKNKYQNINIFYYDFDLVDMIDIWFDRGGKDVYQMVDPFDGFHPNQVGMSLWAEYFWYEVKKNSK